MTRLRLPLHTAVGMDSVMGVRTLASRHLRVIRILRVSSAANYDSWCAYYVPMIAHP